MASTAPLDWEAYTSVGHLRAKPLLLYLQRA